MARNAAPALALAAAILLTGCRSATGLAGERLELASARALWQGERPPSYRYHFRNECGECLPEWRRPVIIRVRSGTIDLVTDAETGVAPAFERDWPTVDSLFAVVEHAIEQRAAVLTVEYDRALGYPTLISVDYSRAVVDDEFALVARELVREP